MWTRIAPSWSSHYTYAGNVLNVTVTNTSGHNYRPTSPSRFAIVVTRPVVTFVFGVTFGVLVSVICNNWDVLDVTLRDGFRFTAHRYEAEQAAADEPATGAEDIEDVRAVNELLIDSDQRFADYFDMSPESFVTRIEEARTAGNATFTDIPIRPARSSSDQTSVEATTPSGSAPMTFRFSFPAPQVSVSQ